MEKSFRLNIFFFIIIEIAIFVLIYLSFNILEKANDLRTIIKLFSTLILPVPLAMYASYISAPLTKEIKPLTTKGITLSIIIFFFSFVGTIFLIHLYEIVFLEQFEDHLVIPVLLNSSVTVYFALNYMTTNNIRIAGFLCGILFGMAVFIFIM
jgi:hypothetical protein